MSPYISMLTATLLAVALTLSLSSCASESIRCPDGVCPGDEPERPHRPGPGDGGNGDADADGPSADGPGDSDDGSVTTDGGDEPTATEEGVRRRGGDDGWDLAGFFGTERTDDGVQVAGAGSVSDIFWIPNTGESTVSRWNAATGVEEARFNTGYPNGATGDCMNVCCWTEQCNMPSRVVVDDRGNAYVANRGFGMQASVTKIAGHVSDCVDREGTGNIDTSTGPEPVPWPPGDDNATFIPNDDCVLWTVPIPPGEVNGTPRAIAVDIGDKTNPEGYVWVSAEAQRRFYRLNIADGSIAAVIEDLPIVPYGALVTADGRLWYHSIYDNGIAWIDTETLEMSDRIPVPAHLRNCAEVNHDMIYGATADGSGRLWFTGLNCQDVLGYDTNTGEWTAIPAVANVGGVDVHPFNGLYPGRGITVDIRGRVWLGVAELNGGGGQSRLAVFDADLFTAGDFITSGVEMIDIPIPTNAPSGIAVDSEGRVWLGHFEGNSELIRFDPEVPREEAFAVYTNFNRVYTYSDFTGAVRQNTIGRGLYRDIVDFGCSAPEDVNLTWEATLPPGGEVVFTADSAAGPQGFDASATVDLARLPPGESGTVSVSTVYEDLGLPLSRWLRLDVTLVLGERLATPTLRTLTLTWDCP